MRKIKDEGLLKVAGELLGLAGQDEPERTKGVCEVFAQVIHTELGTAGMLWLVHDIVDKKGAKWAGVEVKLAEAAEAAQDIEGES